MNAPEPPQLAAHWLATALGDLGGAEALLRADGLPARQAVQLAQQAAEKALKGAIIFGGVTPPRTLGDSQSRFRATRPDVSEY